MKVRQMSNNLIDPFGVAQQAHGVTVIPQNWKEEILGKIAWAMEKRESPMQHPPGDEHAKLWNEYNDRCKEVMAFLDQNYGGYYAVHDLMKEELRKKASPYSIDLGKYLNWDIDPYGGMSEEYVAIASVEALKANFKYCDSIVFLINQTIKITAKAQP